jgi:hypothetical protein
MRLHAGFDRSWTEALSDGLRRSFDSAVELRGMSGGDFRAEMRSLNEPKRRVPCRGRATGHLPSIDGAVREAGASQVGAILPMSS